MTKYYLLLCGVLAFGQAPAQDTIRTLFKPSKVRSVGFYIAPEIQYTQSAGDFTPYAGASAMLLFNRHFAVGAAAQHSLDDRFSPDAVAPLYLRSGWAGLKLEYTLKPSSALHLSFPLVIGRGWASADSLTGRQFDGHPHDIDSPRFNRDRRGADFVVIQPGVQLETNLLRNVQLYAGAHYRVAPVVNDATNVPSDALQGLVLNAGIKAGLMAPRIHKRAHDKALPPTVGAAFKEKFPQAGAGVRWHRERNGAWEAEFKDNGTATSATFDANGTWLETEKAIALADLPVALQTTFQNAKIRELNRIEQADGKVLYEVQVKRKEMLFDERGVLILNQ